MLKLKRKTENLDKITYQNSIFQSTYHQLIVPLLYNRLPVVPQLCIIFRNQYPVSGMGKIHLNRLIHEK